MKENRFINALIILSLTLLFANCKKTTVQDQFLISNYIPAELIDSLKTDIVTYMGVKPRNADWETRHDPRHRPFYIESSKNYEIYRYYVNETGDHFFYIIRPARHIDGNRRAIGGTLRLDEDFNITWYEEIFVTHVFDEGLLREMADEFFPKLIENTIGETIKNDKRVEWPDDRLKYDVVKKEWRYDVIK